jgi:hypothetical protein
VEDVSSEPDTYNWTIGVDVPEGTLPDVARWKEQFAKVVHDSYVFRGIEVTIEANVIKKGNALILRSPALEQTIALAPLKHKLQWNWKKRRARQPEPEEQQAYGQLSAAVTAAVAPADAAGAAGNAADTGADAQGGTRVSVTGPLEQNDAGYVLEVREFFLLHEAPQ